MSKKYKNQRVGVFVDVSNMYHSAKNLYRRHVNFQEVLREVVGERQLIRAIAYAVKSSTGDEKQFFEALEKSGFEIKTKDLQVFVDGSKKADWDVGLSVDAIILAEQLDSVVIVSGDGDYVPLVQYLKINKGCIVEVAAFEQTTSSKLVEVADDFVNLSENPRKFLLGGGQIKSRKVKNKKVN